MIRKSMAALAVFSAALVLFPLVAAAHVEIEADGAPDNGVVATTVSAENECPNNGKLTDVELVFPASPALTTATPAAVTGWTAAVAKSADGQSVEKVIWTNTGQVDGDGTFPLEIGTVPTSAKAVDFKALDTCDNGEVTRWVEPGENSEHPAPVLALKAAGSDAGTTTTTKAADSTERRRQHRADHRDRRRGRGGRWWRCVPVTRRRRRASALRQRVHRPTRSTRCCWVWNPVDRAISAAARAIDSSSRLEAGTSHRSAP